MGTTVSIPGRAPGCRGTTLTAANRRHYVQRFEHFIYPWFPDRLSPSQSGRVRVWGGRPHRAWIPRAMLPSPALLPAGKSIRPGIAATCLPSSSWKCTVVPTAMSLWGTVSSPWANTMIPATPRASSGTYRLDAGPGRDRKGEATILEDLISHARSWQTRPPGTLEQPGTREWLEGAANTAADSHFLYLWLPPRPRDCDLYSGLVPLPREVLCAQGHAPVHCPARLPAGARPDAAHNRRMGRRGGGPPRRCPRAGFHFADRQAWRRALRRCPSLAPGGGFPELPGAGGVAAARGGLGPAVAGGRAGLCQRPRRCSGYGGVAAGQHVRPGGLARPPAHSPPTCRSCSPAPRHREQQVTLRPGRGGLGAGLLPRSCKATGVTCPPSRCCAYRRGSQPALMYGRDPARHTIRPCGRCPLMESGTR